VFSIRTFLIGQLVILILIAILGRLFKLDIGDIATWFGSVGTISTLFFAFYQLQTEREATRENEKRSQASKISAWIAQENGNAEVLYAIQNASDASIHQAIVTLVGIQGAGPPSKGEDVGGNYHYRVRLITIPPGRFYAWSDSGGRGMMIEFGVEIAFKDSNGTNWVRRSNGQLEEIKQKPIEFYNIPQPVRWEKVREEIPDRFDHSK
jgi:hypothetical protein